MQTRPYDSPLTVSGSLTQKNGTFASRLRIADPRRACGYRDVRQRIGPAHRGPGPSAPGTFTKAQAKAIVRDRVTEARWAEADRREQGSTVADGAKRLILQVEADGAVPKTVIDLQSVIRRRVDPRFGSRRLSDLSPSEIADWRDELLREGLSPRSVRRHLGILQAICARALVAGELDRNPADAQAVKRPRERLDPQRFRILTPGQVRRVAAHLHDPRTRAAFLCSSLAGARLGEVVASRWRDVGEDRLTIRRSFNAGREGPPKSGRSRTVPLADELRHAISRLPAGAPDEYVFGGSRRPSGDAFRSALYAALKDAGLGHLRESEPRLRWHDLRHGWASACVAAGVPLTALQSWGGWSSLAILSRYSHWQSGDDDVALISKAVAA
jgi:integrase